MRGAPVGTDRHADREDNSEDFVLREAEVLIGQGGMEGGELGEYAGSRRAKLAVQDQDVVCAQCGIVARGVPALAVQAYRRQHEEQAHPAIFAQRRKLELALLALNLRLWRR
jgi:hypothetical protein